MKHLKRLTLCVSFAVCFATYPGLGEQASGTYVENFNGDVALWDPSGTYSSELDLFSLNYVLNMDSTGKITGQGTVFIDAFVFGADFNLSGTLAFTGTLKSSGNVARLTLAMSLNGGGTVEGTNILFTAKAKEILEVDATTLQLVGSQSGSVTVIAPDIHKRATSKIPKEEVFTTLPPGMDGTWNLNLNLSPALTKYTGDGTVQLSNGQTIPVVATGTYNSKSDVSRIAVKSPTGTKAVNLNLTTGFEGTDLQIQKLTGKALGQSLKLTQ